MHTLAHKNKTFNLKNQYGLSFDGVNEDVNVGNDSSLDFTGSFSLTAWINTSSLTAVNVIHFRSTASPSPWKGYAFDINTAGKLRVLVNGGVAGALTTSSTVLSINTWYYVACTKTSGTAPKIYVNGVETAYDGTGTTDPTTNTADTRIGGTGGISGWTSRQFIGNIDEAAFWNTNLSAAQVLEIYNGGKPTNLNAHSKVANLVAYYRLGDPTAIHDGTNWIIPNSKSGLENKKSVLFDGVNETINIDTALTPLASTTTGTWSCWVKLVTTTTSEVIINFGDTNAGARIIFYSNAGKLEAYPMLASSIKWRLRSTSALFVNNTWAHVALVQDGTSPVFYFNGTDVSAFVETTDKTFWFSQVTGLDNGRLACNNDLSNGNANFLEGNIDEVRFYNTALTAAQITALYNLGNPAEAKDSLTDANLISHWRMGDAPLDTATVIEDVYGSNNGTGVNLEAADLEYDAPMLGVSVNMEVGDLSTGKL